MEVRGREEKPACEHVKGQDSGVWHESGLAQCCRRPDFIANFGR